MTRSFQLTDRVIALQDVPEESVSVGDEGVVIFLHNGGEMVSVEFVDYRGCITGLVTDDPLLFKAVPLQESEKP